MEKIDFSYELSDERLLAYSRLSLYDRLRWLDGLRRFTALVRTATTVDFGRESLPKAPIARDSRPE
jgi:hypothetical protein